MKFWFVAKRVFFSYSVFVVEMCVLKMLGFDFYGLMKGGMNMQAQLLVGGARNDVLDMLITQHAIPSSKHLPPPLTCSIDRLMQIAGRL